MTLFSFIIALWSFETDFFIILRKYDNMSKHCCIKLDSYKSLGYPQRPLHRLFAFILFCIMLYFCPTNDWSFVHTNIHMHKLTTLIASTSL